MEQPRHSIEYAEIFLVNGLSKLDISFWAFGQQPKPPNLNSLESTKQIPETRMLNRMIYMRCVQKERIIF